MNLRPHSAQSNRPALGLFAAAAIAVCLTASLQAADPAVPTGPYTLPPLPYANDALEPVIDAETMKIHHTKHHQAYITNANKLLANHPELAKLSPEELLLQLDQAPKDIQVGLLNNVGGHYNHSLFWKMMTPGGSGEPTGELANAIQAAFGSLENFKAKFAEAAAKRFGSGWAWLVSDAKGNLEVISTPNQDPPLGDGKHPVLGLDVWEHAYYLEYQNRRGDYITEWWKVVNWPFAAELYAKAKSGAAGESKNP